MSSFQSKRTCKKRATNCTAEEESYSQLRKLINNLSFKSIKVDTSSFIDLDAHDDSPKNTEENNAKKRKRECSPHSKRRKKSRILPTNSASTSTSIITESLAEQTTSASSKTRKKNKEEILLKKRKNDLQHYYVTKWSERLICILKEFLIKQQWDAAAKVLFTLTYEPVMTSEIIWKCGFQIFCNHPQSSSDLLIQFAKAVNRLDKVYFPGIILDCVMFFLIQGDFQKAKEIMQLKEESKRNQFSFTSKHEHISNVLRGYEGLLCVVEWKILLQQSIDDEIEATRKQHVDMLGNKAIAIFEELFTIPGNWDIFVNKYIEVMEYYKKVEPALLVLRNYCSLNPLNPNSYVYLFHMVQKHVPQNKKTLFNILKCLAVIDPSEEILTNMKLIGQPVAGEYLKIIFNMIDYHSKKDDFQLWSDLAEIIVNLCKKPVKDTLALLFALWNDRSEWWQDYHFCVSSITIDDKSIELHLYKAIVLSFFQLTDSIYVEAVRQKFNEMGCSNALEKLRNAERIFQSVKISN